jgi:hypothetical protein
MQERTVEAMRTRTQNTQVELRKNKRDELLAKRRNLLGDGGGSADDAGSSALTAVDGRLEI